MTQYDDLIQFISNNPGCTRLDMRKKIINVTHENEILKRAIENGQIYRERVQGKTKAGAWGYWAYEIAKRME